MVWHADVSAHPDAFLGDQCLAREITCKETNERVKKEKRKHKWHTISVPSVKDRSSSSCCLEYTVASFRLHTLSLTYLGCEQGVALVPSHVKPLGQLMHALFEIYFVVQHNLAFLPSQVCPAGHSVATPLVQTEPLGHNTHTFETM